MEHKRFEALENVKNALGWLDGIKESLEYLQSEIEDAESAEELQEALEDSELYDSIDNLKIVVSYLEDARAVNDDELEDMVQEENEDEEDDEEE